MRWGGVAGCLLLMLAMSSELLNAQPADTIRAEVRQDLGVDPRVHYADLTAFGPWDDRNYQMTAEDLAFLRPDEATVREPIPAFFRARLRRENPYLMRPGVPFPRVAGNRFFMRHGGFLVAGRLYQGVERVGDRFEFIASSEVPFAAVVAGSLAGEARITDPRGAAESALAIQPTNDAVVIAGTNGPFPGGGQRMHYSHDGGINWSQVDLPLGGTCCDPTVAWSSDSAHAYTATLGCQGGGCDVWFYRSDDAGQSWIGLESLTPGDPRRELTTSGRADKEYLHVDIHPDSPYRDHVYLTWHENNLMYFARSTDSGHTFDPAIRFTSDPRGIGSDITTDSSGVIFYAWPGFADGIQIKTSTDGGASFGPVSTVAPVNDAFIFAIPVMESRQVFQYVSAAVDRSAGPFADSIYLAWTDSTAAEDPDTPANNHARIQLAYSRNGGTDWTVTTPHPTADQDTVDRFHQWLSVDAEGRLHLIFYDTSQSPGRDAVDLAYTHSADGGVSWSPISLITGAMSPDIQHGFEFGDYNGLDVVGAQILASWTDNRDEDLSGGDSVDVYAAGGFGTIDPSYALQAGTDPLSVCTGGSGVATIDVSSIQAFGDPVTLSAPSLPSGFSNPQFSVNPVTPGASSIFSVDVAPGTSEGPHAVVVNANGGGIDKSIHLPVFVGSMPPVAADLTSPGSQSVSTDRQPVLRWIGSGNADDYLIELDDDPDFSSPVVSTVVRQTQYRAEPPLPIDTLLYWRVTAANGCGDGPVSRSSTVVVEAQMCTAPAEEIPDDSVQGVDSTINLPGPGVADGLRVSLRVNHPWVGDLRAQLSHSGSDVVLLDRPGRTTQNANDFGCAGNDVHALLDDGAGLPAATACGTGGFDPGLLGSFSPDEPLAGFDGDPLAGDWTLNLSDRGQSMNGFWPEWCLVTGSDRTTFPLDTSHSGPGSGRVSSSVPGIDCTGSCSADYLAGTVVTLTAQGDSASLFSGWSGDCSGTGPCTVTLDQVRTVEAVFAVDFSEVLLRSGFEDDDPMAP